MEQRLIEYRDSALKLKKKKFETLLLLKSKDKSAEVTMGFILESPNLVRINII